MENIVEQPKTLADLKVGDPVVIVERGQYHLTTVTKRTPKRVIVYSRKRNPDVPWDTDYEGSAYNINNGYQIGGDPWYQNNMVLYDDHAKERIEQQRLETIRKQLAKELNETEFRNYPQHVLDTIRDVLTAYKELERLRAEEIYK
jgi:hypothetical protein